MTNRTTSPDRTEDFVQPMTDQMGQLARTISTWVQAEARPLQEIEAQVVRVLHDLGNSLLTALAPLAAPVRPAPDGPGTCGPTARYLRMRSATVTTVLGPVRLERALYACATCGAHQAPRDQQLPIAAGGLSLGLQEVLAMLGATQDSFAQATAVLPRRCLGPVCPNSARAATDDLGAVLTAHTEAQVATAQQTQTPPPAVAPAPPRLYLSMDGVLAHTRAGGWKEIKIGCGYTTRTRVSRRRPDTLEIRAEAQRYVAALADAATFGWHFWAEAQRRGSTEDTEVVLIGDGAHGIWKLADEHFPHATQIVDWYNASQYLWPAATTIWGTAGDQQRTWANTQLTALWEGRIDDILAALEPYRARGDGVTDGLSYISTHRSRMDYPTYRARGLHIGSGTVESTCKQIVSARLKLAGMIWDPAGAEAVAVVRAWLKSHRWDEAMRLRPPPQRTYQRQSPPPSPSPAAA
ncbi:MAG: ISKra4 family transposase [Chloroflexales bacterium]|nr:ISKra4 family transposase [Chloroflexales bacterium]